MYSYQNTSFAPHNPIIGCCRKLKEECWYQNPDILPASYHDQVCTSSCNYTQSPVILVAEEEAISSYDNTTFSSHPYNCYQYSPNDPEPARNLCSLKDYRHDKIVKKTRAHISFVPSSTGTFKHIIKRKRKRTVFTTEQVAALEEIFSNKPYVTREERQTLVQKLQINDKAIKIWFQNRRLKKDKRVEQDNEIEEAEYTNNNIVLDSRLDYVQSQIKQKTDEYGFVTLDEGVMGDLVDIIDSFLAYDHEFRITGEDQSDSQSSPIYEPISPASASDDSNEDSSLWRPTEPNESFQRLFDLQTMFLVPHSESVNESQTSITC